MINTQLNNNIKLGFDNGIRVSWIFPPIMLAKFPDFTMTLDRKKSVPRDFTQFQGSDYTIKKGEKSIALAYIK